MKHAHTNVEAVLLNNNLSSTKTRRSILQTFIQSKVAICNADLEKKNNDIDRITIYRTLQTFLKKGIIHNIPSNDDSIKYAMCHEHCTEGKHLDNHIHFICSQCQQTSCLNDIAFPNLQLPKKLNVEEIQILIKGICSLCK